jgi:hypothetical protein
MESDNDGKTRHGYRTESRHRLDSRRLVLRGGILDGQNWAGVTDIGKRVFCGTGEWSREGVYLVTAEVVELDGEPANVAVPAFAARATGTD